MADHLQIAWSAAALPPTSVAMRRRARFRRRVGAVAELVLQPLDPEARCAALYEAREAGALCEHEEGVAHRRRAEPLVAVELPDVPLGRAPSSRSRARPSRPAFGHRHPAERVPLVSLDPLAARSRGRAAPKTTPRSSRAGSRRLPRPGLAAWWPARRACPVADRSTERLQPRVEAEPVANPKPDGTRSVDPLAVAVVRPQDLRLVREPPPLVRGSPPSTSPNAVARSPSRSRPHAAVLRRARRPARRGCSRRAAAAGPVRSAISSLSRFGGLVNMRDHRVRKRSRHCRAHHHPQDRNRGDHGCRDALVAVTGLAAVTQPGDDETPRAPPAAASSVLGDETDAALVAHPGVAPIDLPALDRPGGRSPAYNFTWRRIVGLQYNLYLDAGARRSVDDVRQRYGSRAPTARRARTGTSKARTSRAAGWSAS